MKNAFIFHGTAGCPEENWFPWLKKELEPLGYNVIVPQFPTPENQTLESWLEVFEKYKEFYTPETILIGHSLGGTFILNLLQIYDVKLRGVYLVAVPMGIPFVKFIEADKPFTKNGFDWQKIKANSKVFEIFHSDNDPYVGMTNAEEIAKNLGITINFMPGAGHFNAAANYTKFPELLEKITANENA